MDHDRFRSAWLEALRAASVLHYPDRPEDLLDLGTMSRKHTLRVGLGHARTSGPLFATMLLSWTWTPVHSARTYTNEDDLLTDLLGRDLPQDTLLEPAWIRIDIQLCATTPYGEPIPLDDTESLRRWTAETPRMLQPYLRDIIETGPRGIEAIHGTVSDPEARVACHPSGSLQLLSVELEAWRSIQLPQASDRAVELLEDDTSTQLTRLAKDAGRAFDAWKKSLAILI
jgi:hypothetical protein